MIREVRLGLHYLESARIIHLWAMPELPDVDVYVGCLRERVLDRCLERVRIGNPFVLRSVSPPTDAIEGKPVTAIRRMGKRIVFTIGDRFYVIVHLMVAGRLRWRESAVAMPRKSGLAAFDFSNGTLLLTEAGSTRRASLYLADGVETLATHDRGGLEVLEFDLATFDAALRRENHTLKRALTDPRLFSGIGNAYSDEILHAARLSPVALTQRLDEPEVARLHAATIDTLYTRVRRLREDAGDSFPEKVTAFRKGMAVHGRYRQPCPVCGSSVQRIVYAHNEVNYCATCQTNGKLLADRAMSRLLKRDWPRTLEAWEGITRR